MRVKGGRLARLAYQGYEIMNVLLDYKIHSVRNIARDLSLSRNTVARHVNELAVHFPILIALGKYGGVRLSESFTIGNRYFSNHDTEILVRGLLLLQNQSPCQEVERVIRKLTPQKE